MEWKSNRIFVKLRLVRPPSDNSSDRLGLASVYHAIILTFQAKSVNVQLQQILDLFFV